MCVQALQNKIAQIKIHKLEMYYINVWLLLSILCVVMNTMY